jgi:hypothetical protein
MSPIEALEAYSSSHPETMEQLLNWPYRRFIKAFEAWQRRKAIERTEHQEDLHIAAMYSNTNMDDPDNNRGERVKDVQSFYGSLRQEILGGTRDRSLEPPDEHAEAFMRASRRSVAKITGM